MKIGDCVTYGTKSVAELRKEGWKPRAHDVGRVVSLYQNRGVDYAKVAFGMRTSAYPLDAWRVVDGPVEA